MTPSEAVEGARVRVTVRYPETYAYGCAACLDSATGTIEKASPTGIFDNKPRALVRFDTPRPTWSANQQPPIGFWFDIDELVPIVETAQAKAQAACG